MKTKFVGRIIRKGRIVGTLSRADSTVICGTRNYSKAEIAEVLERNIDELTSSMADHRVRSGEIRAVARYENKLVLKIESDERFHSWKEIFMLDIKQDRIDRVTAKLAH